MAKIKTLGTKNHITRVLSLKEKAAALEKRRQQLQQLKNMQFKKEDLTNKNLLETEAQAGYYMLNKGKEVAFEKLNKDEVIDYLQSGTLKGLKRIDEETYKAWEAVHVASETIKGVDADLAAHPADILATIEGGVAHIDQLTLSPKVKAELKTAAKAYVNCGISLTGAFAEIGVSGEISTTIGGKYLSYNAKLYGELKAGVSVSPFGAAAAATAEVGAEHSLTATTKAMGKVKFETFFGLKAYVKAEASAAVGYNALTKKYEAGTSVSASIGLAGTISAKLLHLDAEATTDAEGNAVEATFFPVGALSFEANVEVGFGLGFDAEVTFDMGAVSEEEQDGRTANYVQLTVGAKLDVGAAIKVGVGLTGTLKIEQTVYERIKDKLKIYLKKLIKTVLGEQISQQIEKAVAKIKALEEKALDQLKTGTRNLGNYAYKYSNQLGFLIGRDHAAIKAEIKRQTKKMQLYKDEAEAFEKKLHAADGSITPVEMEAILLSIKTPELKAMMQGLTEDPTGKVYIDRLQKYAKKYQRRIVKLNAFLNESVDRTYEHIHERIGKVNTLLGEHFKDGLHLDPKEAKHARKKINHQLEKLDELIDDFDRIVSAKDDLLTTGNELIKESQEDLDNKALVAHLTKVRTDLGKELDALKVVLRQYRKHLE